MSKVSADISVSLDGFVAGPNDSPEQGLGKGGERLHEWLYGLASFKERHGREGGTQNRDSEILDEAFENVGAVILGRRMFDNAQGWGDEPPFRVPVFVLTHRDHEKLEKEGGTSFTFVSDGLESALEQARAAAGEKDVSIAGGADTIQQFLRAGHLDEIQVHVAPLLLGAGVPLFGELGTEIELERTRVVESDAVTHIKFQVKA